MATALTDTKDRLTPMAFEPDPCLLNLPLARPWRRGLAMLADLIIIAFFASTLETYILPALLVLWIYKTLWFQKLINKLGKLKTILLRSLMLALVIIAFITNINSIGNNDNNGGSQNNIHKISSVIAISTMLNKAHACQSAGCWEPFIEPLVKNMTAFDSADFNKTGVESLVDNLVIENKLPEDEIIKLKSMFYERISLMDLDESHITDTGININFNHNEQDNSDDSSSTDGFSSFLNGLGLSFGFATLYFTCFTAWWKGQTPGKILLHIQIIQLDNSPISLWEAFGRYGGYGAGIATGFLGFLQIYWDANRQAIQDKIAASVVIDLGLKNKEDSAAAIRS